jgi:nitrogen fixation NifU-like protein
MVHVNGDGRIDDIKFSGSGCAISMASASMMTGEVMGKSIEQAKIAINDVVQSLRGEKDADILDDYGNLAALKAMVKFPVRVKCATLSWHALKDALDEK